MLTYKFRQDRDQYLVLTHQVLNFKTKSLAEPYFKRYGKKEIYSEIMAIFAKLSFNFNFKLALFPLDPATPPTHPWKFIFRTFSNPTATTTLTFYLNTTHHHHPPGIVAELQLWLQSQLLLLA